MAAVQVRHASAPSKAVPLNPTDRDILNKIAAANMNKEKKKPSGAVPYGVASSRTWTDYVSAHSVPEHIKSGLTECMRAITKIEGKMGEIQTADLKPNTAPDQEVVGFCYKQIDVIMRFTETMAAAPNDILPKFFIAVALLSMIGDMVGHASSKFRRVSALWTGTLVSDNIMHRLVRACAFGVPRSAWSPSTDFNKLPADLFLHLKDVLLNGLHMNETMTPGFFALQAYVLAKACHKEPLNVNDIAAAQAYVADHYKDAAIWFGNEELVSAPAIVLALFMKCKEAPFLPLDLNDRLAMALQTRDDIVALRKFVEAFKGAGVKVADDPAKFLATVANAASRGALKAVDLKTVRSEMVFLSGALDVDFDAVPKALFGDTVPERALRKIGVQETPQAMGRAMVVMGVGCFGSKDLETYYVNYLRQTDRKELPIYFESKDQIVALLAASDKTDAQVPVPINDDKTKTLFDRLLRVEAEVTEPALDVMLSEYGSTRWMKTFSFLSKPLGTWPPTKEQNKEDASAFLSFLAESDVSDEVFKKHAAKLQHIYAEHMEPLGAALPNRFNFIAMDETCLSRRIEAGLGAKEVCKGVDATSELGAKLLLLAFQTGRQDVVAELQAGMAASMAGQKRKRDEVDESNEEPPKSPKSRKVAGPTKVLKVKAAEKGKKTKATTKADGEAAGAPKTKKAKTKKTDEAKTGDKPPRVKRKANKATKESKSADKPKKKKVKTSKKPKLVDDDSDSDYEGSGNNSSSSSSSGSSSSGEGSAASPLCIDDEPDKVDEVKIPRPSRAAKPQEFELDYGGGDTDEEDFADNENVEKAIREASV